MGCKCVYEIFRMNRKNDFPVCNIPCFFLSVWIAVPGDKLKPLALGGNIISPENICTILKCFIKRLNLDYYCSDVGFCFFFPRFEGGTVHNNIGKWKVIVLFKKESGHFCCISFATIPMLGTNVLPRKRSLFSDHLCQFESSTKLAKVQ